MQNPNEDTEWNDVLRAKGILPAKPKEAEINEDDIVKMLEDTIKQKSGSKKHNLLHTSISSSLILSANKDYQITFFINNEFSPLVKDMADMDLDELDELEDEEEEQIMLQMRNRRIAEMKALQAKSQ